MTDCHIPFNPEISEEEILKYKEVVKNLQKAGTSFGTLRKDGLEDAQNALHKLDEEQAKYLRTLREKREGKSKKYRGKRDKYWTPGGWQK